jgi:predicted amidohydrolase
MNALFIMISAALAAPLRIAALHDTGPLQDQSGQCGDRLCRLEGWMQVAAAKEVQVLVAPEYVLQLSTAAGPLAAGAPPPSGHVLSPLAEAAARHQLSLVLALWLRDSDGRQRNAQVVLGPDGTVQAIHHKVELFSGEREWATPGTDLSVVELHGHTVGLMICADLYAAPALHAHLVDTLGAELVLVSAEWTAAGARRWGAAFAHDWGVPVVFANTGDGMGVGSGIYDRLGQPLAESRASATELLVVDLPLGAVKSP